MMNNKAAPSYFNGGTLIEHNDYRQYVISRLPKLKMLDHKEISNEERAESKVCYNNSFEKKNNISYLILYKWKTRQDMERSDSLAIMTLSKINKEDDRLC
jgi:hypothetical protein